MERKSFNLPVATTRFKCPVTGLVTKPGETYYEDESGYRLHISQMPARRLRPIASQKV